MIHENIELTGSFVVSGSFVLPNHNTTASLVEETGSMYHDTVDGVLKIYTGTQWVTVGEQTGPEVSLPSIEYLLVAGGGGAGGYSGTAYEVGDAGSNSTIIGDSITTITSIGGGRGAVWNNDGSQDGGSGGGASGNRAAGSGTVGQGNDGGAAAAASATVGSGGGGGAGENGAAGTTSKYGDGGDGLQSSITGTSTYYAGGGGAGGWNYSGTMTQGLGGLGGGGNGTVEISDGNTANAGNPGVPNTGGGAGAGDFGVGANHGGGGAGGFLSSSLAPVTSGSSFTVTVGGGGAAGGSYGATGGSGVAIFAYDSGSLNCAGGIVGDAGNGRKYNQFNESGTFKVGSTSDLRVVENNLQVHLDAGNFASRGTSTWNDLSGNGHNATINGATLTSNPYYSLDGSNNYFSIPHNNAFNSQTITIETWTWFDQNKNYNQLYTKGPDAGEQFEAGGGSDGGVFTATVWASGRAGYNTAITNVFTVDNWIHLVQVIDPSQGWLFYKNGSLIATDTTKTGTTIVYNSSAIQIGGDTTVSGRYLDGRIAQFRYYTKGLSATEVLQNYNATKTNFV